DVDLLVPREMLPARLANLLRENQSTLGASVVQWFEDRAHFIVLCARGEDAAAPPVMLQLHVSSDYDVRNRLIYAGKHVIRTRRRGTGSASARSCPSCAASCCSTQSSASRQVICCAWARSRRGVRSAWFDRAAGSMSFSSVRTAWANQR